MRVDVEL